MRVLSGRSIPLSHTFVDDETTVTGLTSVAVSVVDASGASVFTGAATNASDVWSVTVPSKPEGVYTVTWTATGYTDTTSFEVVGGFIFDIADLRALDPDLTSNRFSTAKVKNARERVEAEFERITGRSFTPRTKRVTVGYDGTGSVWLQTFDVRSLASVTIDGTAATDLTEFSIDSAGFLSIPDTFTSSAGSTAVADDAEISAKVAYGFTEPPYDVHGAALLRARDLLSQDVSGIPDRATSFVADNGGQFVLATAGARGWETGLPEVDAVIKRYRYDILNAAVTIGF